MNRLTLSAEFTQKEIEIAYYRLAGTARDFYGLPVPLNFKTSLNKFFIDHNADIVRCIARISAQKILCDFIALGLTDHGEKGRGTWEYSHQS